MFFPPSVRRLLAACLGLLLCLTPEAAFALPTKERVAAIPAPSPYSQESDPASDYRAARQRLSQLGYDSDQIRILWGRLGPQLIAQLDSGALSSQKLEYLLLPNCSPELLERCLAYARTAPDLSPEQVVLQVRIGLDRPFYTSMEEVQILEDPAVLVNKYHPLPADYVPELEPLGSSYGSGALAPAAAQAFRQMADAARLEGVSLRSVSAYRSYATQERLYRDYLSQGSQRWVDTFSARPGHSEHQTGLALDINVARISAHFEDTAEFAWLQEHCAEYGFILRYPEGKDDLTGYRFEPWHYRYVGTEIAQACTEGELTLEEYTASLPVSGDYEVPALFWQGDPLDLGPGELLLDGVSYLSPQYLAPCLGWSVEADGPRLVLSGGGHRLVLSPGRSCRLDSRSLRLGSPALELDGSLYLSLDDLCSLFSLEAVPVDGGLELTHLLPDPLIL